jgi:MoaA/NifB/PqqE/SkfB family radical SAM enzyme
MFFLVPKLNADGTWFDAMASHRTQAVNIEFTSNCNLRCSYCAVSQSDYVGAEMSADTVDLVYRGLQDRGLEMVTLNGHGETTMIPAWPSKLKPFIDNFPVGMTSNFARSFSAEELDAFARFKSINISLDAADAPLLQRIRRKVRLGQIVENLANTRAAASRLHVQGPKIYIFCTVYDENVLHLEALAKLAVSLAVTGVVFNNLVKYPDVAGACNVRVITSLDKETRQQARRAIDSSIAILREHGISVSWWDDSIETFAAQTSEAESANAIVAAGIQDDVAAPDKRGCSNGVSQPSDSEETRDCFEPWLFAQIDSRANVLPCCVHTAIGVLDRQHPLDAVLNNAPITRMRSNLLLGRLDTECTVCRIRRRIEKSELRRRYISQFILARPDQLAPARRWRTAATRVASAQFSTRVPVRGASFVLRRLLRIGLINRLMLRLDNGVPPDLKDRIRFENVTVGQFAIGDRIYLHPNRPNEAPATVRFHELLLQKCSSVDLYLYKDSEKSDDIQFDVAIADSSRGRPILEDSRVVKDAVCHWVVETPMLDGRYDLTVRTRMAPGANSVRFARAHVGYPIFQGSGE